jgi:hypothetical protein
MIFDDLPLWAIIGVSILTPPLITGFCWLVGPRLAAPRAARIWKRSQKELWLLLVASYAIFAVAVLGARYLEVTGSANPTAQLFQ